MNTPDVFRIIMYVVMTLFFVFLITVIIIVWVALNKHLVFTNISNVIDTTNVELPKMFLMINDTLITTRSALKNVDTTMNTVNTDTLPKLNATLQRVDKTLPKLEAAANPQVSTSKTQVKQPVQKPSPSIDTSRRL